MSFNAGRSCAVHIGVAVDSLLFESRTFRRAVARFAFGVVRVNLDHLREVDLVHSQTIDHRILISLKAIG